eukprot:5532038-Pyramimonas_sp.AAC.1
MEDKQLLDAAMAENARLRRTVSLGRKCIDKQSSQIQWMVSNATASFGKAAIKKMTTLAFVIDAAKAVVKANSKHRVTQVKAVVMQQQGAPFAPASESP